MDELEWESLKAWSTTLGPGWHGRVPLGGKDPLTPRPPRQTTAEQLASAHLEYALRNYSKTIELARGVEEDAYPTAQRADALRLQALAHAAIAEWIQAIAAGEKALALDPEGVSDEVASADLPALIEDWRERLIARAERRPPPYGGLIS